MMKRIASIGAVGALMLAAMAPALAHEGHTHKAPTYLKFRLADHNLDPGQAVTAPVTLKTERRETQKPLAGATLTVKMDGNVIGTLTTDSAGAATVSFTAPASGEHTVKVVYAGDDTHRSARRGQGFTIGAND